MACKRRSSSSSAISPSSDSSYASPSERDSSHSPTPHARALHHSSPSDIDMGETMPQTGNWSLTAAVMAESPPRHLDSRTRKRFRNGRPDDSTVYSGAIPLCLSILPRGGFYAD